MVAAVSELNMALARKAEAETREIEARIARAVEQDRSAAERAALRQKALEIAVAKAQRDEALLISQPEYQQTLSIVGSIDRNTATTNIDKLSSWHVRWPGCPITVLFNSPGGSVLDGLALFDYLRLLRSKEHRVTTVALGYAASMAGILLQAGDVRVMAKDSWLLIHEVAFSASGKLGEVEDSYEFGKRLKEQAADIFIERSKGLLTREELEKGWNRKDWWLSPTDALTRGLIDEIW